MNSKTRIRVAAAQLPAYGLMQAEESLAAIEQAIQEASRQGAELLVLPECAYPAYLIQSVEAYRDADILSSEEYLIFLGRWARKKGLHIVSGYVEDVGTHLYNASILIDDAGQCVGNYRKSFLWGQDNEWFEPGECISVYKTSLGRIGMIICADTRAPEIVAKEVIERAELIAMPTCWINTAKQPGEFHNPQPEYLIKARASEFSIPFVCANKFGMETENTGYCGRSMIVDATGTILQEAPGHETSLLVSDLELRDTDRVHYHDELWQSLIHWVEPVRPQERFDGSHRIAICHGSSVSTNELKVLVDAGVVLVHAKALADEQSVNGLPIEVVLPQHAGAIRRFQIGHIACILGSDLNRFSRTRLLALGGMEILCVFNAPDDLGLLRTRAMENRVFVLAANDSSAAVVDPSGRVICQSDGKAGHTLLADIVPAEAGNKRVAPDTDIWQQRRPQTFGQA